jgi:hypothetical protein
MRLPGRLSGVVAACLLVTVGGAQEVGKELSKGPQVTIRVPAGASVDGIQTDFYMGGRFGAYASTITPKPSTQRYVFDASVDEVAASTVQAVVYMPGCELSRLEPIVMHGENVERQVECKPVSQWPLRGQLVMDAATVAALGKRTANLEIEVAYMANWVNVLFGIMDGAAPAFHVATVPLGEDGSFLVQLPNFALDPAEKSAEARFRGEFVFTLREKKTWNVVGTLRPTEFARMGGLELRTQYPGMRFELKL